MPGQGTEEALGKNKEQIKGNGIVSKERVSLREQFGVVENRKGKSEETA